MSKAPKLGKNLEWHGRKIRVVVSVPPRLRPRLGRHLRQALPTDSPKLAEVLKHKVVGELKERIMQASEAKPVPLNNHAALVDEGLWWRSQLAAVSGTRAEQVDDALSARLDKLERGAGEENAKFVAWIAYERMTPLAAHLEDWITTSQLAPRVAAEYRRAVSLLATWLKETGNETSLEAVTPQLAARFVFERFVRAGANHRSANKVVSALSSYWNWLLANERLDSAKVQSPYSSSAA